MDNAQTLADQIPEDVFFTIADIRLARPQADTMDIAAGASTLLGRAISEAWVVAVLDALREAAREVAAEDRALAARIENEQPAAIYTLPSRHYRRDWSVP